MFSPAGMQVPERRRLASVSVSIGLHVLLVLAVVAVGQRATLRDPAPSSVEMMFNSVATPALPPEPAATPQPDTVPAVSPELIAPSMPQAVEAAPVSSAAAMPPGLPELQPSPALSPIAEPPVAPEAPREERRNSSVPRVSTRAAAVLTKRPTPAQPPANSASAASAASPVLPPAPAYVGSPPPTLAPAPAISPRWQSALASWVRSRIRYPDEAARRHQEGVAIVSFTVGRDGQVLDALLRQKSGSEALDQAALSIFHSARVPPFPPEMAQPQVTLAIPVRYRLED